MKGLRPFVLLAASLTLWGCVALEDMGLASPSPAALEWTAEDAKAVSRPLVQALMLSYSSDSAFSLNGSSPLGTAIEAQLRESGYAISAASDEAGTSADVLQLSYTAGVVNGEEGTGPVWAALAVETWRVDGLFVRGDEGRLELSGGLTVRDR